jgi:hypothetical protein
MNSEKNTTPDNVPEIVSTRVFNVSRTLLFEAYSNPEILVKWWGPNGFTNTFHEFNFTNNGTWNFLMHGPDGKDYKNNSVFREIVPMEKIVFDHLSGPYYRGTVLLKDAGDSTQLIYTMVLESRKVYEKLKDFIIGANEENFDRLEEILSKMKKS